jgi:2-keto-4-pentenoate hydratase
MTDRFHTPATPERVDRASGHDLRTIAQAMKSAQDTAQQLQPFSSLLTEFDVPAAYEVAALLHKARVREGARPVGRKIGFTNRDMWSRYGVRQPIWAYMYDRTVRTGAQEYVCSIGRFVEPKVEPEIVVHFRSAPPANSDMRAILECIDWIAHAFEIVQSHFPGWKFQATDTIVDCALHGTLLVGEPLQVDHPGEALIGALEALEIALYCGDELRAVGRGSNVLGNPLIAIAHLIRTLAEHPLAVGLEAGEMVTTGTVTTALSIGRDQTWRSQVRGLGLPGLSVRFEA